MIEFHFKQSAFRGNPHNLCVFLVTLIRTGFGSMSSILSFSGWFLSTSITLLVYFLHKASVYGLSVTSALFHQVGQIIMVIIIYELPEFINYLPILLTSGAISGVLVAFVSQRVLYLLNRIFRVKSIENEQK